MPNMDCVTLTFCRDDSAVYRTALGLLQPAAFEESHFLCSEAVYWWNLTPLLHYSWTGARAAERSGAGLWVWGPYNQLMDSSAFKLDFGSLASNSEGPKLCLKGEVEEMLYLSAHCLGSHFSAFIAISHSSLAEPLTANNLKQKVFFDR